MTQLRSKTSPGPLLTVDRVLWVAMAGRSCLHSHITRPSVLANSPTERGQRVRGCLTPKWLLQRQPPSPQADKRLSRTRLVELQCYASHRGQLSACPTAGQGCSVHVGRTGYTTFRNAFFGGTPASLDYKADGPRLLAPRLPAPRRGQHLQPAGLARPLPTIAQS